MNNPSNASSVPFPTWARPVAIGTAAVYFISLLFPIFASLSKDTMAYPKWWGALDVGLAFILAILAFTVYGLARGTVNRQSRKPPTVLIEF